MLHDQFGGLRLSCATFPANNAHLLLLHAHGGVVCRVGDRKHLWVAGTAVLAGKHGERLASNKTENKLFESKLFESKLLLQKQLNVHAGEPLYGQHCDTC